MLTRKQQELLVFIHERLSEGGISPSFDEMKDALGLKSKSGIHRLIGGLEERGFLRRLPHRARALEVLRLPDGIGGSVAVPPIDEPEAGTPSVGGQRDGSGADRGQRGRTGLRPAGPGVAAGGTMDAAFARGRIGDAPANANTPGDGVLSIPLCGKIAAGSPIEALAETDRYADVPAGLVGSGEHYALEVEGDSMIDAGIQDGDTVIIRRGDTAENGQIVVALVEEEEVTLKRLQRRGGEVTLVAENPAYAPRKYPADRVRVQGRLVGLMRRY